MSENMELELNEVLEEQVTETPAEEIVTEEKPKESKKKKGSKKGKKHGKHKKKKKSGAWFIVGMFLYAIVFLGAAFYGLKFLWGYLEAYEASRPANTITAYMDQLTKEHIVDQCQEVFANVDHNIQSEEACRQLLLDEMKQGIRYAKKSKECTDTRQVYVIKAGTTVVGQFAIEANEPDEFGFTTWELVEESFDMSYITGTTKSITVPDRCTVTVNGVKLDESYIIEDNIPYEQIKEYYEDYELPHKVTYQAGPLLGDFEMVVTDIDGTVLTIDDTFDSEPYYFNVTAQETEDLDAFTKLFLEKYIDFTGSNKNTRHKTYNALIEHVVAGSDLAQRLKDAIEGLQFGQSKGDEIVSIDTHLRIRLGEKYLVDMTYEVDTTGREGVVRTATNARILMVKTENGFMTESIILY